MRNKQFTITQLERARKALALLKSQKARGLTGLQRILEAKPSSTILQPVSNNHRKVFKAKSDTRYRYEQENANAERILPCKQFDQVFGEEKISFQEYPTGINARKGFEERQITTAQTTKDEYLDIETVECEYCNRKFNAKSLSKHLKVCDKRPDKPKRKLFDSSKARAVEGVKTETKTQEIAKREIKKVPLWKTQSEYFRRAVGSKAKVKAQEGGVIEEVKPVDYVKCETCGRSFNSEAAKRHLPFCANRLKMEKLKNPHKFKNTQSSTIKRN